jgi:hypothetical protein
VLGLATTIVVASVMSALTSHWDPERVATGKDYIESPDWGAPAYRTWSQTWIGVEVFAWVLKGSTPFQQPYPEYRLDAVYQRWPLPSWSCLRDDSFRSAAARLTTNIRLFADWRAGWPLAALRGRLTPASLTDAQPNQFRPPWNGGEGMLRFRDATPRISIGDGLWLTGHLFPLIPIWPNFLIDAALYAAGWWGVLLAAGRVRVAVRRRRDRCVGCGYDVRSLPAGAPCPECGRAR